MRLFTEELIQHLEGTALTLAENIREKNVLVGVVGLGYVGMPIAVEFGKKGFRCLGVDVSEDKVSKLNRGENYIEDLKDEEVAELVEKGLFSATTDYEALQEADIIYIAVPTPFNENKDPDLGYVIQASEELAHVMSRGKLVILKSTTFPGTTEEYLVPRLNKSGLTAGKDFYVAFSPERVDPGNKTYHTGNTPIITGGLNETCTILASWINHQIIDQVYMVKNPRVAEMEKLLENIFRSVNIALVNELALLCERIGGIDVWEVIEAASTKPFGFKKFTPGPGVGGHCIPVDPYYLSWLAREYDFETKFITLAANVNESMPYHVTNLVMKEIAKQPIRLQDARILILGVSFKKNVKDLRNSPSEAIIHRLLDEGVTQIDVSDPWADEYKVAGKTYYSVELTEESIASYNTIIMITDHDLFDVDFIVKHATHIIDTRNMTAHVEEGREKITLLGYAQPKQKPILQH
ncbi:MAG: nucleotide sugar dehydrogenase [Bacteroidota bacterium]